MTVMWTIRTTDGQGRQTAELREMYSSYKPWPWR